MNNYNTFGPRWPVLSVQKPNQLLNCYLAWIKSNFGSYSVGKKGEYQFPNHNIICTLWEGCCFHPLFYNTGLVKVSLPALISTLVTQPMMQRRPNCTELSSMDSYIQILCRFQKSKQKVPPPSPLSSQKSPFTPPKDEKNLPLGG